MCVRHLLGLQPEWFIGPSSCGYWELKGINVAVGGWVTLQQVRRLARHTAGINRLQSLAFYECARGPPMIIKGRDSHGHSPGAGVLLGGTLFLPEVQMCSLVSSAWKPPWHEGLAFGSHCFMDSSSQVPVLGSGGSA